MCKRRCQNWLSVFTKPPQRVTEPFKRIWFTVGDHGRHLGPSFNYVRPWREGGGTVSYTFPLCITCKKGKEGV